MVFLPTSKLLSPLEDMIVLTSLIPFILLLHFEITSHMPLPFLDGPTQVLSKSHFFYVLIKLSQTLCHALLSGHLFTTQLSSCFPMGENHVICGSGYKVLEGRSHVFDTFPASSVISRTSEGHGEPRCGQISP